MLRNKKKGQVDLRVDNHGSVALLHAVTERGQEWVEENVQSEDWQHIGGAIACEPRLLWNVVQGAQNDGLNIQVRRRPEHPGAAVKRPKIYRVRKPCSPGYEGKWCLAVPNAVSISFWYYDTRAAARAARKRVGR